MTQAFSQPKGCENAIFKVIADLKSESIMYLHYGLTLIDRDIFRV